MTKVSSYDHVKVCKKQPTEPKDRIKSLEEIELYEDYKAHVGTTIEDVKVMSKPFKRGKEWFVKANTTHDRKNYVDCIINLADYGITPYDDSFWNAQNYMTKIRY